jgi:D-tyrosyl-tRNA(Tyr) deacylase
MLALLQRVSEASVTVEGERIAEIGAGLLVLVCAIDDDPEDDAAWLAEKIAKLRIFEDDAGKLNRSVADVGGAVLAVSQFTLAADARKGNRPSFVHAARPDAAVPALDRFVGALREAGLEVRTGRFGADMKVGLVNDGPITIWLDTRDLRPSGTSS